MLKQVLRVVIVSALVLAVASPAWAGTINVILDDPTTGGGYLSYFLPYGSSNPYNMVWQNCTGYSATSPVPPDEAAAGYKDCLAITNNTDSAITNLILTIPDTGGDTFLCSVSGSVTGFGCSSSTAGGVVTLDFVGLPGFLNNTEIYIGVGLPDQVVTDLGNPTVYVPTYDPSTLVLLAVGMAMLAMGGGIRRYA
jgi:hypothetical protein